MYETPQASPARYRRAVYLDTTIGTRYVMFWTSRQRPMVATNKQVEWGPVKEACNISIGSTLGTLLSYL